MSIEAHVPEVVAHARTSPAAIPALLIVPVKAAPADVTVTVPMAVLVVVSVKVTVGFDTQLNVDALPIILSTVEALTNLTNAVCVEFIAVNRPG